MSMQQGTHLRDEGGYMDTVSDAFVARDKSRARTVRVTETRLCSKREWDAFAESCNATYRSSYGHIFSERLWRRVRVFAAYVDDTKIAQCAISFGRIRGRRDGHFIDALQLLPSYEAYWEQVTQAVLDVSGPGRYRYGSKWNIEPPRAKQFAMLRGTSVESVTAYNVQVVDFAQWPSWEAYEKAVSQNARRNAAKALKSDPTATITINHGRKAVADVVPLIRMKFAVRRRKGLKDANMFISAARYVMRTLLMNERSYTAKVTHSGRAAAYFSGVDFGLDTYYLDGASLPDNGGAAWLLMLKMLRRAWRANGKVFISMYEAGSDWAGKYNILLSRQQLRVTEFPCEIVTYQYVGCQTRSRPISPSQQGTDAGVLPEPTAPGG
jgi:hypothetical protein